MTTSDAARPSGGETEPARAPEPHPADGESFGELGPILVGSFLLWIVITIAVSAAI